MTARPAPALRILIGVESTADAPIALRLAAVLAQGKPAEFGGLLVVDTCLTDPRGVVGGRIVTASGQMLAVPKPTQMQSLLETEARAFRQMLAETAEKMGAHWTTEVASGTLETGLATSAGAWDVMVIGHRALHRRQGIVVFLTDGNGADQKLQNVAKQVAEALKTRSERLRIPQEASERESWLVDHLNRMNAAAVVIDAASTSLGGFRHLTALLTVARCPIVVVQGTHGQRQLAHSIQMPPSDSSA